MLFGTPFRELTGYFGMDNIYIGGSYSYSKALDIEWNGKDIDIFILIPRIESWALVKILNLVFDSVHVFDFDYKQDVQKALKNKSEYYRIEYQWKRAVCYRSGIMYDLIFIDSDLYGLLNSTGSSISKLYHKMNYKNNDMILIQESKPVLNFLKTSNYCIISREKCTDAYASKIVDTCNELGYKYGS